MGSSNEGNTDANEHILYTHQHMHTDLLAHIKYINETECPELHNIEVPKVYFPSSVNWQHVFKKCSSFA